MTDEVSKFVLDANVFIQAKNQYYSFAICPGFWETIPYLHRQGRLWSIDRIAQELHAGHDDLAEWVGSIAPGSLFASSSDSEVVDCFATLMGWVQAEKYHTAAKATFASTADAWLIAYAKVSNSILVTHEAYQPAAIRRVPIPNVCRHFGVRCVDTFSMLRELEISFTWNGRKR